MCDTICGSGTNATVTANNNWALVFIFVADCLERKKSKLCPYPRKSPLSQVPALMPPPMISPVLHSLNLVLQACEKKRRHEASHCPSLHWPNLYHPLQCNQVRHLPWYSMVWCMGAFYLLILWFSLWCSFKKKKKKGTQSLRQQLPPSSLSQTSLRGTQSLRQNSTPLHGSNNIISPPASLRAPLSAPAPLPEHLPPPQLDHDFGAGKFKVLLHSPLIYY